MRLVKLEQTCFACPSQWEGEFEDGTKLYARYRWGALRVSVDPVNPVSGKEIYYWDSEDSWDGFMSSEELRLHLGRAGITFNTSIPRI